ncbi:MAG: NAD(P)H-hydrate dehydratase [Aquificaceae bacterium]|nr:NAD(P)H-hydrate dehydratase [Aquificaceae bacterium]
MKVLKAKEMQEIDRRAIEGVGIPSVVLMEKAGLSVAEVISTHFPERKRVLVVAGRGNNGGDGLVVARHLHLLGYKVGYFLPFGEKLSSDTLLQFNILKSLGLEPLQRVNPEDFDLLVDALYGTGFEPPVRDEGARWIEWMNATGLPIVSVDIPSGLSADSGRSFEPSVKAEITVTFQFPKLCHLLHPASKKCGRLFVANIGIPKWFADVVRREVLLSINLREREVDAHKGRMGHVLLVGGSVGKTGAVIMSARASTRAGAGLVSVGIPKGLNPVFETSLIEEMTIPLSGEHRLSRESAFEVLQIQERFSAVALGMGMERYEEGREVVKGLILGLKKPLLIDADGLNNLADLGVSILKDRGFPTVLTPHVGEFERLTGLQKSHILENLTEVAVDFATEYGCYVVLKSSRTAIATPDGKVYLSTRGTPAMAKGGVGDVLSGVLIALIGRGFVIEEALKLGVFLHGLSGEVAEKRQHRESLRALDLVDVIPEAYNLIENGAFSPPFTYIP